MPFDVHDMSLFEPHEMVVNERSLREPSQKLSEPASHSSNKYVHMRTDGVHGRFR